MISLEWGRISQIKNILRWLKNYQSTGILTNKTGSDGKIFSKKYIRKYEKKLRADNFNPPVKIKFLIDKLEQLITDYHSKGIPFEDIQLKWGAIRPKLVPIFHEERVLPVHLIKEEKELGNSSRSHKHASILHLIRELDHINGSKDLIMRLKKRKESAYSEALLATYFYKMGFEICLEPVVETGHRNDIAVKLNSECVNIEVKTPQKSDIQKEIERKIHELSNLVHKLPFSRNLYIFLTKEPNYKEQQLIIKKTLKLALSEQQPTFDKVNEVSYIKTDNHVMKPILLKTRMIRRLNIFPSYPESIRHVYEARPVLFFSAQRYDTSEGGINVNLTIHIPFEDKRVISMINKKRKQLSRDSMNLVAFDTTHIPIPHLSATKTYDRWITRLKKALKTELSRRIGAVLIFSRLDYGGKISIKSSLFVHPNPYKRLPQSFLDKCNLNSYEI